ncbi:uncharacterized protein EAE97_010293 [Botrytis byssoidea]|uniref:Uncharacterized protein n=1 Tax=Botrytis byssoidea TaxID=139641 RepID=A0A9P5I8U7_9HELO|nr:uncharacterized protein EAE97_010293 [Botrytis byssoidea]KAF7926784.1 hypothetical protein EAE97_010293 [Botrytis byssoidea]
MKKANSNGNEREAKRGRKCTRREQLQRHLKFGDGPRNFKKRMKRRHAVAHSNLRVVTLWNGVTEEAIESRPGIGQTLDGKMEEKGKAIARLEVKDVSDAPSNDDLEVLHLVREPPLECFELVMDDESGAPPRISMFEEVIRRKSILAETTKLESYDVERIALFHQILCRAYNDIIDYTNCLWEFLEGQTDSLGWVRERWEDLISIKDFFDEDDKDPEILLSPVVIMRRFHQAFIFLEDTWKAILDQNWGNLEISLSAVVAISDVRTTMKSVEPQCDNRDFDKFGCRYPDGKLQPAKNLPTENCHTVKRVQLFETEPPAKMTRLMEEHASLWIKKLTGCPCGTWCAGPSQSS